MPTPRAAADSASTTEKTTSKAADDGGKASIQALADEATEKGYFGTVPDPIPNSAYSLASGPDSPSAAQALAAVKAGNAGTTEKKEG